MKKRGNLLVLFLILTVILSLDVYSIGISPSRIELAFEPNKEIDCSYLLLNNAGITDLKVFVYPVGDLNESIEIEQESVVLKPHEWTPFNCKMKLPSTLEPGLHDNGVVASETDTSGGMVGSIAAVKTQIWIRVPYPGKYLEGRLRADDTEINKEANFDVNLISRGDEDINNARIYIDIFDSSDNKVGSIESESLVIKPGESRNINLKWNSQGNSAGAYNAIARVYYDNNFLELNDGFRIGDFYIEIINVSVENIKRNSIGKFDIQIQSMWNGQIDDVYGTIEIFYNNNKISSINSESVNLEPWGSTTLVVYWDSKNALVGDYKAKAIVNYKDKSTEKTIDFKVVELSLWDKLKANLVYIIIIIILIILILANIIITLFFRRKDKKNKG